MFSILLSLNLSQCPGFWFWVVATLYRGVWLWGVVYGEGSIGDTLTLGQIRRGAMPVMDAGFRLPNF